MAKLIFITRRATGDDVATSIIILTTFRISKCFAVTGSAWGNVRSAAVKDSTTTIIVHSIRETITRHGSAHTQPFTGADVISRILLAGSACDVAEIASVIDDATLKADAGIERIADAVVDRAGLTGHTTGVLTDNQ